MRNSTNTKKAPFKLKTKRDDRFQRDDRDQKNSSVDRKKASRVHLELSARNLGKFQKEKSIRTIYIGNLSYTKEEFAIKDIFKAYGEVSYVRLIREKETQKSRGIAFVQMPDQEAAQAAIKSLNKTELDGRTLKVSFAQENSPKNRPAYR